MSSPFTVLLGKAVRYAARLRGGGSALPGLFVEKIDPSFVPNTLAQLPKGVVIISGTNGKTTTTKMVVQLLESQGLTVFTNRTGSNFVRGVAAALLGDITATGKLRADIAVLELDEAHAVKFVDVVQPRYSLLLNVMRDQLDRFGEIDSTAKMLEHIAKATTETVVANREDERILSFSQALSTPVQYFGLDRSLLKEFPTDNELYGTTAAKNHLKRPTATVVLSAHTDTTASYVVQGVTHTTSLRLNGVYNMFNSAAALALTHTIVPKAPIDSLIKSLATVTPAFGRGESFNVDGNPLELVLVKNPSGFRLGLTSFDAANYATMIAINDNYADGRDMSWLWDVDFTSLQKSPVAITGIRGYDMALRLDYDQVPIDFVATALPSALKQFIAKNNGTPKRIYCTYTAMLALRKELAKITHVEVVA
tara:strand:- start:171 stop:1439 length:1269 start_codon:yes stop_codon:yes gene_type:complete